MMDRELVEVRQEPNSSHTEESERSSAPDLRDQRGRLFALRTPGSTTFAKRPNDPGSTMDGAGDEVVLSHDGMRSEVAGVPVGNEGRCVRSQLAKQVAQFETLAHVVR
jgi:hypothetical protein